MYPCMVDAPKEAICMYRNFKSHIEDLTSHTINDHLACYSYMTASFYCSNITHGTAQRQHHSHLLYIKHVAFKLTEQLVTYINSSTSTPILDGNSLQAQGKEVFDFAQATTNCSIDLNAICLTEMSNVVFEWYCNSQYCITGYLILLTHYITATYMLLLHISQQ